MEFVKFNSLENTYNQKEITRAHNEFPNALYWVSEKLDGANFSVWYDGTEVKTASRNQWVDETFYGATEAILDAKDKIVKMWGHINDDISELCIYGELFGDGIQKRVVYGKKRFVVFDIHIDGVPINLYELTGLCGTVGFNLPPIIGTSYSLQEALEVNYVFRSYETPEGFEGENEAEGVTIAPMHPLYFKNGSRVWLKQKTANFSERKNAVPKKIIELSDNAGEIVNSLLQYNTESRVCSVISKIGAITNKDFGRILGETIKDMIEDFERDTGECPKRLLGDEWKQALKGVNKDVSETVRSEYIKHL
jgi:Rnl2 family RNA ligase